MDIQKLLVADPSAEFCGTLADALGGTYALKICHDGLTARELLDSFRPDVLVLDLALPELDGIAVLKAAANCAHRPSILVTTRFISPYIESAVDAIGVDYVMMKPCDIRALVERIRDLAECAAGAVFALPSPGVTVTNMLLTLNISTKRTGFRCLEEAISLVEQKPGQSMTKVVYPAVAKILGGNRESVERAIRAAIHAAWESRDEKAWRLYFHPARDGSVPRPTNMAFISTLAQCLKRQQADRVE